MDGKDESIKIVVRNRRARHEYELLETIEAGIALQGTEVKSIRAGHVNMGDAYARARQGSLMLEGMHISPWATANDYDQHHPTRARRLLLHKREIRYLLRQMEAKGLTVVPVTLYFKRGKLKVELAVARGKRLHDKRQSTLKREAQRDMERAYKHKLNR